MIHVSVGTDTYGRVKQVDGTPIVTKFGMVSAMPVFPIQSYYFMRFGEAASAGIPFLAAFHSTPIVGIPLARLDKLSVVMTYARGLFGGMAIIGFIFTFMAFMMWVTGERLDELSPNDGRMHGCLLRARGFCRPVHLFVPFADDKAGACNPAVMSRDTGDRGGSRTNAARFRQDSRRHVAPIARTYRAGRTGARTGAHASTHCAGRARPRARGSHRRFAGENQDSRDRGGLRRAVAGNRPKIPLLRHKDCAYHVEWEESAHRAVPRRIVLTGPIRPIDPMTCGMPIVLTVVTQT